MDAQNILINGKAIVISLDTKKRVNVNWKRLELAQEKAKLVISNNDDIVFDSGLVASKSPFFELTLPVSVKRKKYVMALEVTAPDGTVTIHHKTFYSSNGNLNQADWITRLDNPIEKDLMYFNDKPNMIFEKAFEYQASEAEVFLDICGLGYYTVKINGRRLDDTYLNNDISNYSKVVYFDAYDIRAYLTTGTNVISVELANGWYNPAPFGLLGKYNVRQRLAVGKTCLIAQVTQGDRVIVHSDSTWVSKNGNYLFNNLFIGERMVTAPELFAGSDAVVNKTVKIHGPAGELVPSHIEKMRRTRRVVPKSTMQTDEGILIDFGTMLSGQFACTFAESVQGTIRISYSEAVDAAYKLAPRSCISGKYLFDVDALGIKEKDSVEQVDEITKGDAAFQFENQYVYHSFRYVLIQHEGISPEDVTEIHAYFVHTDLASVSSFESSNAQFNHLWQAALNTKLNNVHGIFEDCPRERLGYGGDIVALIDSQLYSFDVEQLLMKSFNDFINDQTGEGGVPQTAPYIGIQTNGPSDRAGSLGWQLVLPTIALNMQQHYFKPNFIADHADALLAHANYLLSFDYDYIKHCCLADWGAIDAGVMVTPDREFCSTVMYVLNLKAYAELLQDDGLSVDLNQRLIEVSEKITDEFYHEDGYYQSGSQSSYAFALKSGLVDDALRDKIVQNYIAKIEADHGIFRTGIFGMPWTYQILSAAGRDDLVNSWLNRKEFPSFYEMASQGINVLREHFGSSDNANMGSFNHAMFSSYPTWLMERILGIKVADGAIGANKVVINPYFPEDMNDAKGHLDTIMGTITSQWVKKERRVEMILKVPIGMTYELQLAKSYRVEIEEEHVGFYKQLTLNIDI
ncbi:MAG: glycoside hydrolase family 78 protein [Turicibacter sp.]|nr:glycoside hydrolase family 78 protein [Turicibacter sp.]